MVYPVIVNIGFDIKLLFDDHQNNFHQNFRIGAILANTRTNKNILFTFLANLFGVLNVTDNHSFIDKILCLFINLTRMTTSISSEALTD